MGVSIFSGGVTTFGSAVFLYGASILFFTKFAVIILSTVAFSLAYALIYFQALCHAFGPQYNFGSLKALETLCFSKDSRVQTQKDKIVELQKVPV